MDYTRTVAAWATTKERLPVVVSTSADPTAGAVEFAFTALSTEPTSWTAGIWSTTFASSTGQATAATPTVGGVGSGATIELAAGSWRLWVRWTVGVETPVRLVGQVDVL